MSSTEVSPMKMPMPNRTTFDSTSKHSLLLKTISPAKSSGNISQIYPADSPRHPLEQNRIVPLPMEQEVFFYNFYAELSTLNMPGTSQIQLKKMKSSSSNEVLDEFQERFQIRTKKEDGLKTMIGKGIQSLIKAPGEVA